MLHNAQQLTALHSHCTAEMEMAPSTVPGRTGRPCPCRGVAWHVSSKRHCSGRHGSWRGSLACRSMRHHRQTHQAAPHHHDATPLTRSCRHRSPSTSRSAATSSIALLMSRPCPPTWCSRFVLGRLLPAGWPALSAHCLLPTQPEPFEAETDGPSTHPQRPSTHHPDVPPLAQRLAAQPAAAAQVQQQLGGAVLGQRLGWGQGAPEQCC